MDNEAIIQKYMDLCLNLGLKHEDDCCATKSNGWVFRKGNYYFWVCDITSNENELNPQIYEFIPKAHDNGEIYQAYFKDIRKGIKYIHPKTFKTFKKYLTIQIKKLNDFIEQTKLDKIKEDF